MWLRTTDHRTTGLFAKPSGETNRQERRPYLLFVSKSDPGYMGCETLNSGSEVKPRGYIFNTESIIFKSYPDARPISNIPYIRVIGNTCMYNHY